MIFSAQTGNNKNPAKKNHALLKNSSFSILNALASNLEQFEKFKIYVLNCKPNSASVSKNFSS